MLPELLSNCFQSTELPNSGIIYRWNLNCVPDAVTQIMFLHDLIQYEMGRGRACKIRQDKRKRAQGLVVVFSNPTGSSIEVEE
jgi:hypothetical protein